VVSGQYVLNLPDPLAVLKPAQGDELLLGQQNVEITWSGGTTEAVTIQLYRNNAQFQTIAVGAPNTGSYTGWTVPRHLPQGSTYQVAVIQGDDQALGEHFTIAVPPLVLTAPTADTVINAGTRFNITWTGGAQGDVRLVLMENYSQFMEIGHTNNDGSHSFLVPMNNPGGNRFRIYIAQGSLSDSSPFFEIAPRPITVTYPNGDTLWHAGTSSVNVQWSGGSAVPVDVFLMRGGVQVTALAQGVANDGASPYFSLPVNLNASNSYQILDCPEWIRVSQLKFHHRAAGHQCRPLPPAPLIWQHGDQNVPDPLDWGYHRHTCG
jgi:hypothetical protein